MVWQQDRNTGFYVGIEPTDVVKYIYVSGPNIARFYNQYMGGIDRLNMMSLLFKPTLQLRRW